jgi:hypothetical protein
MMFRHWVLTSLGVAGVFLLLGCGDDDSPPVPPTPTATATATATATPVPTSTPTNTKEQACIESGGQVTTITCNCTSTPDFFNTCGLGACTCAPGQSRQIQSCDCGSGKCFDGTGCVSKTIPG